MAYINVIEYEESEGRLREIYDDLIRSRGKLAEVHKIQSLNPETIVAHMELYLKIMFSRSPLKRYQREMIAVVVSITNNCAYCTKHHAEAVQHFWKSEEKVNALVSDFRTAELKSVDRLLCELAEKLTKQPAAPQKEMLIEQLAKLGLNDRAILDATLVIAYFNFVNRLVLGLGVHLEDDGGGGYKYD
ncbi:MAG: peroxidase-related enzyme [Saprospiraceae bacterium]|nr:peroxidase-related enzyme [Saprospiraceae bacterium]